MSDFAEKAAEKYKSGYNCAQSVLCAFCDEVGLSERDAFRMAEGFGGGIGGMRGPCGAVTAMFTVLSYINSDGMLSEGKSKANTYKKIREASQRFEKEYGSTICKEILASDLAKAKNCEAKVRDAAAIIAAMLAENRTDEVQDTDKGKEQGSL